MNPEAKLQLLRQTGQKSRKKITELSEELASAGEKEDILAGLEFENWLADSCSEWTD